MDKNKPFLKKADTTAFDKYNCGNCTKFGTRWCPFVGTENEPTAETRACEHFDKSYTVLVENIDQEGVSIVRQEEPLYKHYETPTNIKVEQDQNEPFSHACGQCSKFGTIECPYKEKSSKARACQAFAFKCFDGDQIKMQDIDYESLTYDMPGQGPIHPSNPSRRDLVEHPFEFKIVHPEAFRVANIKDVKTARLSEEQENALNTYILGLQKIKSSGLLNIESASYDANYYEKNKSVVVFGKLKEDPSIRVYYRMTAELGASKERAVALVDSEFGRVLEATIIGPNEDVTNTIRKMVTNLDQKTASENLKKNLKANE